MDMVLLNILKAQSSPVIEPVSSSNNVNNASTSIRIPENQLISKSYNDEIKLMFDIPEKLEEFEDRLKSD